MTKLYRNTFPGDAESRPVPTTLTDVEQTIRNEVNSLHKLISIGEVAKRQLAELRARCTHDAFFPADGTLLNARTCAACGVPLGLFIDYWSET